MSVKLPITGGHLLIGNDAPAWMGTLVHGNAMDIGVELDTHAEADRIFAALSEGATSNTPSRKCSTALLRLAGRQVRHPMAGQLPRPLLATDPRPPLDQRGPRFPAF